METVPSNQALELQSQQDNALASGGELQEPQPYLGTWKTKEAAEEGFGSMKKLFDQQANELGTLRKQTEFLQRTLEQSKSQQTAKAEPQKPQGPDYDKELTVLQDQIAQLDPDEPSYHKDLSKLITQSNRMAAHQATQVALTVAQAEFKKTLDERDIQAVHKDFYRQNPDFNTPEMQMRIQEYLAKDQTGMSDPLVAYREVQRDDAMAKAQQMEQALAEKERLLALKQGADSTGKVVSKGQSPQIMKTKKPQNREELFAGAMEALQRAKGG